MRNLYLLFLLISICFSFTKQNKNIDAQLLGIWEPTEFKEGIIIFEKKKRIRKKHQAYHFKNDRKIFMRLAGILCGSEKAFYTDEIAEWTVSTDSILTIKHDNPTAIYKRNFKFLKISNSQLFLKTLDDQEIRKKKNL